MLKKRIFAILFHLSSSDTTPKHVHCPPGEKSWCFWQRALAKSETPGSHKSHETLPADIGKCLVPIFQRLSEENLLRRCARGATQNANESLHNVIWRICPKSTYVGRKTTETAVAMALSQFSLGASFKSILCKVLGFQPGTFLEIGSAKKDLKRLKKSAKDVKDVTKKRRRDLKYKKAKKDKTVKRQEGETYEGGKFNS